MILQKRVTILVAIYRSGQFIKAKLQTLKSQTIFNDCHIVLLNCQNIDDEAATYDRFVEENSNVSAIYTPTYQKLYDAWNDGIAISNAPYIMNSNCDDMLHPQCVERLADALDRNSDYGVVHSDAYVTAEPNRQWPDWSYYGMIETMYPHGTAGPAPMWRRSLHQQYGMFESKYVVGDALMWHKWHINGVKFLRVPEPLVCYFQNGGGNLETRVDQATGMTYRSIDLA